MFTNVFNEKKLRMKPKSNGSNEQSKLIMHFIIINMVK